MRKILLSLLLAAVVIGANAESANKSKEEKAATVAAAKWLKLVDTEKYPESWEQAAPLFKEAISKSKWLEAMDTTRKFFGKNISRKVKSRRYHTELPGVPDGKYVVIQFQASFAHKKDAIETITSTLDKDGKWRVSGYYIK